MGLARGCSRKKAEKVKHICISGAARLAAGRNNFTDEVFGFVVWVCESPLKKEVEKEILLCISDAARRAAGSIGVTGKVSVLVVWVLRGAAKERR